MKTFVAFLLSFSITCITVSGQKQDILLLKKTSFDTIDCKIVKITDYTISYFDNVHQQILVAIPRNKVLRCEFSEAQDKIIMPKTKLDTIPGIFKAYFNNNIIVDNYINSNFIEEAYPANTVFACCLGGVSESVILNAQVSKYLNSNLELNALKEPVITFNKNDNRSVISLNLNSNQLSVTIRKSNNEEINTYVERSNLKSIDFCELRQNQSRVVKPIAVTENIETEVSFRAISLGNITVDANINGKIVNTILNKDGQTYIIFAPQRGNQFEDSYSNSGNFTFDNSSGYKKVEFLARLGYGYRTAKNADGLTSEQQKHNDKLRGSLNLGGEIVGYISSSIGLGFRFDYSTSSTKSTGIMPIPLQNGSTIMADVDESVSLITLGPSLTSRSYLSTTILSTTISPCYILYYDDVTLSAMSQSETLNIKGNCIGVNMGLRVDLMPKSNVCPFLELSALLGTIKEVNYQELGETKNQKVDESLARIQFTFGIKIH